MGGLLIKGIRPQTIPVDQVLFSEPYRKALNAAKVQNFGTIKTLSEDTANKVIRVLNTGMAAGKTPTVITNEITERFDVSRSNAKRISETEINKAFTDAKMEATTIAGDLSQTRSAVRHISALTPTTRPSHAARHRLIFTVEDQEIWWSEGVNRINCKCSVESVLLDRRGNVLASS